MTRTYITSTQHKEIQQLLTMLDLTNDDLRNFWTIAGTPKTFEAAKRMINILNVKLIIKRLGLNANEESDFINAELGYSKPPEYLNGVEVARLHKALKHEETRRGDPEQAPFVVATLRVDSTAVYLDQLEALKATDLYIGRDVVKVLFVNGKATRFSIGGVEFQPVDYREWR